MGPPPGEANRKQIMESGQHGAASIQELVEAYRIAHATKDLKKLRPMLGTTIGQVHSDGTLSTFRRYSGDEVAIEKLFSIPIDEVLVEPGPLLDPNIGTSAKYYHVITGRVTCMVGNVRGKIVLVTNEGKHLDPGYILFEHYGGRLVMSNDLQVTEDAFKSYQTHRPQQWLPLPLDPKTPEEKAFEKKIMRYK